MLTKTGTLVAVLGTAAILMGLTSTALAQDDNDNDNNNDNYNVNVQVRSDDDRAREGLFFGIGAGAGTMQIAVGACPGDICEGTNRSAGVNSQIGWMLRPNLALVGDVSATIFRADGFYVGQGVATLGPQLWITDRLWAKGGVGAAASAYRYDLPVVELQDRTDLTLAATAATGFELISRDTFALDVRVRGDSGFYGTADTRVRSLTAGVGATWY